MISPLPVLSVVGLGRLGAPLAACLASCGFSTIGVDVDPRVVARVDAGMPDAPEPGLHACLATARGRLSTRADAEGAVAESDLTFVVVPTPSDNDGEFSLRHVLAACEGIGRGVAARGGFPVVVIVSTVMPGATGGPVRAALERASGQRAGVDFGLCYNPEFVALGSVIRDLQYPDFILVGESDLRAGDVLVGVLRRLCPGAPPVARMTLAEAELAKLAVNAYVTTKITFANMLARLCEQVPGARVDVVTRAVGLDTRIGTKYLTGATAYGGPCFPRDNHALAALARRLEVPADLAAATDRLNRAELERLATLVESKLPAGGAVGVLGLAYKPGTDVIEGSPGVHLANRLTARGVRVTAYDPGVTGSERRELGEVRLAPSLAACLAESDVAVIVTPWDEFRSVGAAMLEGDGRPRVIIDCWRILDAGSLTGEVEYVALGIGPERPARVAATRRRGPSTTSEGRRGSRARPSPGPA